MEPASAPSFARLLKRYRVAAGLTQEELAERARLSPRTISDLERGAKSAPRRDTVGLLAEAFGLSAEEREALEDAVPRRRGPSSSLLPGETELAGTLSPLSPGWASQGPDQPGGGGSVIGRAQELDLLEQHLAGAGPPVLLFAGEPGIGKTRLLQEVQRRAPQGVTVLWGGCHRHSAREPFSPLLELLERSIEGQAGRERSRVLEGCSWLVQLLPDLGIKRPELRLAPEQERHLMFRAVGRYLANVAGSRGVLLLLDDLQWAGSDAIELLAAVLRSPARIRVVGAYRGTDVGPEHPLTGLIAAMVGTQGVRQVVLGPLSHEESVELLAELVSARLPAPEQREEVVRRAEGIPFYLVSFAAGVRADDHAHLVPLDVVASVRQRVAALPEAAQDTLRIAAVSGRRALRQVLYDVARQPEETMLGALDDLLAARLLVEDGADGYCFGHELIRELVEADLGAARRAALHGSIGRVLEDRFPMLTQEAGGSEQLDQLAYHFARSELADKAVQYLEQAGDVARARYAYAAAEGYYRELITQLGHMPSAPARIRVGMKLGEVLTRAGRYDEALGVLEQAAELAAATGDRALEAQAVAQMGDVHFRRARPKEGIERIRRLLEAQADEPPLAELHLTLAQLCYGSGEYREMLAAAERASELARDRGDERAHREAEFQRGLALQTLGSTKALSVLEEVARLAEAVGDLLLLTRALHFLGYMYFMRGGFTRHREIEERALRIGEQVGDPDEIGGRLQQLGVHYLYVGKWEQAREHQERALAVVDALPSSWWKAYALIARGELAVFEGRTDAARKHLEEAMDLARTAGDLRAQRIAGYLLTQADLLEGRAREAQTRLEPLLDRPGLEEIDVLLVLDALARTRLWLGDVPGARALVEQGVARARAGDLRFFLAGLLAVAGMVATREERWEDARAALEEALTLTRSMPWPLMEGEVLYQHAAMHARRGEQHQARQRLEEALAIFQRLGAQRYIEQTEQALAALDRA